MMSMLTYLYQYIRTRAHNNDLVGIFSDSHPNCRFTNAGDTVVSFSAERHNVVEGALERSRRVEVFVSKAELKDDVRDRMKTSFTRTYKDGKWKVQMEFLLSLG